MALAVVSACLVSVGSASVGAPRGGVSLVTPQQGTRSQHSVPWRAGLAHLAEPRLSASPCPGPLFSPFLAVLSGRQVPGTGTHLGAGMAHLSEGRAAT